MAAAVFLLLLGAFRLIAGVGYLVPVTVVQGIAAAALGASLLATSRGQETSTARLLLLSGLWAAVSTAWAVYLITSGTTHWAHLAAAIFTLVALVMSVDALASARGLR